MLHKWFGGHHFPWEFQLQFASNDFTTSEGVFHPRVTNNIVEMQTLWRLRNDRDSIQVQIVSFSLLVALTNYLIDLTQERKALPQRVQTPCGWAEHHGGGNVKQMSPSLHGRNKTERAKKGLETMSKLSATHYPQQQSLAY